MEVDLKVELVRQGMVRLPRGMRDVRTKTIERVTRHDRSAEAAYPADRIPGVPPVRRNPLQCVILARGLQRQLPSSPIGTGSRDGGGVHRD